MSSSAQSSGSRSNPPPLPATLPIDFVIVGGGIAGLACALALRRVGHHVQVLERTTREAAHGHGGIRVPPNLSKILFHWGLREPLMARATVTKKLDFMRYESGERLGEQVWDEEMLKETRGIFLIMGHADLYDVLYDAAVQRGAKIRYEASVQEIDIEESKIYLATGEEISADVIVGADGEHGVSRTEVIGRQMPGTPTGLALYDTIIEPELLKAYSDYLDDYNGLFAAFGRGRAIVAYPLGQTGGIALQLYAPDCGRHGRYGDAPSVDLPTVAENVGDMLKPAVLGARKAVPIPIRQHDDLDDWVSDDGPLVLIGEAAHPFPPSTIQGPAMAVEDGAVLAKIFSHISSKRQIQSFLYAFHEIRQERVRTVRAGELASTFFMTADGPEAVQRDAAMLAKAQQGGNVLDSENDASAVWDEYRVVFGYDCEDEADDWWVQWGVLRERARGSEDGSDAEEPGTTVRRRASTQPLLDFSKAMSAVETAVSF